MLPLSGLTVSAVEQLQAMASKRQYKEAAAQLEVLHGVHMFAAFFDYRYVFELHHLQLEYRFHAMLYFALC